MNVYDEIKKVIDEKLNPLTVQERLIRSEKYDIIKQKQTERIKSEIIPKYNLQPLLDLQGVDTKIAFGITIKTECLKFQLEYEEWRSKSETKDQFLPDLVDLDISISGRSVRNNRRLKDDTVKETIHKYIKDQALSAQVLTMLQDVNYTELMRDLWVIAKESFEEYNNYRGDELDQIIKMRSELFGSETERIFNAITSGDNLKSIVTSRIINIRTNGYRSRMGYSLSSTPFFDKITSRGGFRILHSFENEEGRNSFETVKPEDVKKSIKNSLRGSW